MLDLGTRAGFEPDLGRALAADLLASLPVRAGALAAALAAVAADDDEAVLPSCNPFRGWRDDAGVHAALLGSLHGLAALDPPQTLLDAIAIRLDVFASATVSAPCDRSLEGWRTEIRAAAALLRARGSRGTRQAGMVLLARILTALWD